jgi:hypothetical protein
MDELVTRGRALAAQARLGTRPQGTYQTALVILARCLDASAGLRDPFNILYFRDAGRSMARILCKDGPLTRVDLTSLRTVHAELAQAGYAV